jgi:uncharacterized protein YjbI with pentapeptide repeats
VTAQREPSAPRIQSVATASRDELLDDLDWFDLEVSHEFIGASLDGAQLRGTRCVSSAFTSAQFRKARFVDTVFDQCELSGAHLDETGASRVEFRNCRMSGVQLNASRWKDVAFVGCRLDGANFRMFTGERIWFDDCVLRQADFRASTIEHARFRGCDLTGADFAQARIPDAALYGSTFDQMRGIEGLIRPVIDSEQVMPFAGLLLAQHGVVVHDEGEPT